MVPADRRDGERQAGRTAIGTRVRRKLWAAAAALGLWPGAGLAQDINGTWLTEGGNSQVRIAPCGSFRCATIVWTRAEARDVNNPDPGLRSRSLVGVRLIADGRPEREGWTGTLYNPLDGRTYAGKLKVKGPGELELSGCVLAGLFCRSQTWTRLR